MKKQNVIFGCILLSVAHCFQIYSVHASDEIQLEELTYYQMIGCAVVSTKNSTTKVEKDLLSKIQNNSQQWRSQNTECQNYFERIKDDQEMDLNKVILELKAINTVNYTNVIVLTLVNPTVYEMNDEAASVTKLYENQNSKITYRHARIKKDDDTIYRLVEIFYEN
ncbi:MAG: hypothetical protein R3A45_09900 [Bdellovibrionota bacterium]